MRYLLKLFCSDNNIEYDFICGLNLHKFTYYKGEENVKIEYILNENNLNKKLIDGIEDILYDIINKLGVEN